MIHARIGLMLLAALAFAGTAVADESADFVVKLGNDTTSVEHYTRTANHLEIDQVGRAPRTIRRHFTYEYANGAITSLKVTATPPGAAKVLQTIDATFGPDSMTMTISGGAAPQVVHVGMAPGTVVVSGSSPWAGYESQTMKLAGMKGDSLRATMYLLGFPTTNWLSIHKLGRDSMSVFNEHQDQFHVHVDKAGRILGVLPIAGTGKVSVERVAHVDVDAVAASFMAREAQGAGMGQLSTRDTVVVSAGGASLWIDYGRPAKRGRVIFGNVVPYGDVWRTGANAATQFKTDKALQFGATTVPAGFYTLWTIPSASGWKLVINSETGEWGTEHKAAKDLYTIDIPTAALSQPVERFTISVVPSADGGEIHMDWDTTRAIAAFKVQK